eukprot:CAMPEP_0170779852 /NCGR_PEP_ID=MMETSP0733-20121128/13219_1 /TAXON_ID=186038 /ORGANISM="Fragilariopsis kerguelensis, Strain L26-C5" /LENGTH=176 /DNA_ID=CAMNT_0011123517 /DNA_START=83 /DNA_END=613 /DNA_ORIENTATION=+
MISYSLRAVALFIAVSHINAFSTTSSFSGSQVSNVQNNNGLSMEYIPSGMSKEQWKKMKEAEKGKNKGKNLGANGISTFKSRSFADWQKAGGVNLFPVDPKKVKDPKLLPYMQRPGGMADGSDLSGKKKKKSPFGKKKKSEPVAVERQAGSFSFGGKKKAPEPEPVKEKKKKFWEF